MTHIGDLVDGLSDEPAAEVLERILAAVREQQRIDGLWLAIDWRYTDLDAGVWANVLEGSVLGTCPSPLTPWRLGCASRDDWAQHLDGTWYTTAGEAKTAIAAAVLDHQLAK